MLGQHGRVLGRVLGLEDPRVGLFAAELDDLEVLVEDLFGTTLAAALAGLAGSHADKRHVHLTALLDLGVALVIEHGLALFVIHKAADNVSRLVKLELRRLLGTRLLAVEQDG